MNPARWRMLLLVSAIAATALRVWSGWCYFPLSGWNAIRLAPTFMLRFGPTPYPGLNGGPITTWIYGPVPLFLNLPATLAQGAAGALLVADVINLLVALVPLVLVLWAAPGATRTERAWALALCLALWPNSSLQYLQSDNIAVAFGLLANLLLLRARADAARPPVLAALCTALAVWSKQTSLGLVLAQLLWLGHLAGWRAAARHAAACAGFGLALGGAFLAQFGWDGLWLNLVRIPGHLPYWPSALDRTLGLAPHLAGYVVLPVVVMIVARRTVWRDPAWLLPVLTWLCLLPTSMVSIYKIGGTANSLNNFLYLLPAAALATVAALREWRPRLAAAVTAAGVVAIVATQLAAAPGRPLRPLTSHLASAEYLAREFPGQIYFPWNPLVTYFSDHRFYHAEDGLYARYTAQLAPSRALALRDLPPRWCVTTFQGRGDGWGIVKAMQPATAQSAQFGPWELYSWPPPAGPGN